MFFSIWKKYIIFSFLFSIIISELVVLNFNRIKDIYNDDDDQVSLNLLKNEIYCNMTIGDQLVPFFISFDKELTFIVDNNYTFSKYHTSKSSNFKKKSEKCNSYVFEHLQYGFNATDTFKLTNENNKVIKVRDMPFILGTYLNEKDKFNFSAQLGLKKKTYQNPQVFNFIENLKLKNIINSQVFFFKFDKGGDGGQLIIGAYPHEFDSDYDAKYLVQSSSLEMGTSNNWFLKFNYFFYGDNKTNIEKQISELSPEKGMIVLNLEIEKIIYEEFFKDLINEKKCVRIKVDNNVHYICLDNINLDNFKNITLRHIGMEYDFILDSKDLFYHYYDRYFFLISFRDTFYIYLGKPFFTKYDLIFNQDSKQLAIYSFVEITDKKLKTISLVFPIILIIIFTILVFVFVYVLFVYRIKKRKKNEINEYFDYNSNINPPTKKKDTSLLEMTSPQTEQTI